MSRQAAPLGVGIDISHERDFVDLIDNRVALERTFSAREIDECLAAGQDAAAALARRFAAKEALMKACRHVTGALDRIEIVHDDDGAPLARWEHLRANGLRAQISLSSAHSVAVAVAIVTAAGE
ncbi:MAG TPA: 4'-phosphopantetheinyl transferase superfamily protein [Candidatus Polarisedimenticolaceae bacterium]|nr:4'-phosphopantetheinyl transferase superfamily protein [Candidatus Polarisedimenticolaceae bacterium]